MDQIRIAGGKPLHGSIHVQGSKNAALPIMAASFLYHGSTCLKNCPKISDVFCMQEIMQTLGVRTEWRDHDLYIHTENLRGWEISEEMAERMRSSVTLLAPILVRKKRVYLGYPGGCTIGVRPIDLHIRVLKAMGARVIEQEEGLYAECEQMRGAAIVFPRISVGAVQQAILAAVLAEGETNLYHCAREPEICALCRYLRKMGACIEGDGTDHIRIWGVTHLSGEATLSMEIPPDRIVAGTYLCAGAATRGKLVLEGIEEKDLRAFLRVYQKMGGQYRVKSGKLYTNSASLRFPVPYLETREYPGFPTDLQSPLMAVLLTIRGMSHIRETIFENRFLVAGEFAAMGADLRVKGRDAWIYGGKRLSGGSVHARELRGGAALIIAALACTEQTLIDGYAYIQRGYEDICGDLRKAGADIQFIRSDK